MKDEALELWSSPGLGIEWEGPGYYALAYERHQNIRYYVYCRDDNSLYREYWDSKKLVEFVGYDKVAEILVSASRWITTKFFDEEEKWTFYTAVDRVTIPK